MTLELAFALLLTAFAVAMVVACIGLVALIVLDEVRQWGERTVDRYENELPRTSLDRW